MKRLLLSLTALLLAVNAPAAVLIKNADIAVGTINPSRLDYIPVISTPVLQGADTQFFVSSGTVGTGGLTVLGAIKTPSGVVFSSSVHVAAFSNTLGAGSTFYAFTPDSNITLIKLSVTIHTEGTSGSSVWSCRNGASALNLTTLSSNLSGSTQVQTGAVNISAGNKVSCSIYSSTQEATPTGVWELEYQLR